MTHLSPGLPMVRNADADNIYWVYGLVLDDDVPFDGDEAIRRLAERGVSSRPFFWPMHEQPVFRRMGWFADEHLPVAARLGRRGFYVPSGLALSDTQIDAVAAAVQDMMRS